MSEPNTVDIERRLRERSEAFVLKPRLSWKSDVWKNSLVFEKPHDVHDSAACDFCVLWVDLWVGSGPRIAQNYRVGSGYAFSGSGR